MDRNSSAFRDHVKGGGEERKKMDREVDGEV